MCDGDHSHIRPNLVSQCVFDNSVRLVIWKYDSMGQALKKKAHLPIAEVATYSQDSQSSRGMETD